MEQTTDWRAGCGRSARPVRRGERGESPAPTSISGSRHGRVETERFKCFTYDELTKRDKINLDIFWLKDDSLADSDNLPAPGVIALEIVEDLQAALEQFKLIAADLTEGAIVE